MAVGKAMKAKRGKKVALVPGSEGRNYLRGVGTPLTGTGPLHPAGAGMRNSPTAGKKTGTKPLHPHPASPMQPWGPIKPPRKKSKMYPY